MPTLRDTYLQGLTALLSDADRLGSTPDDIAARALVLAEVRHAIAAGLGEDVAAEELGPATLPHGLRDEDGWIPWAGGACPCPDWPTVEYRLAAGYVAKATPRALAWGPALSGYNIIAYRRPRD